MHDAGLAIGCEPQKTLGGSGCNHGVQGCAQPTLGSIFKPHRGGESAGQLPMGLRFGGAGANGRPADQTGDVLGCYRIEKLRGRGNTHFGDPTQQGAGFSKPTCHVIRSVEMGIADQPFPAKGGAWFLEVDPHDQQDAPLDIGLQIPEPSAVFQGGGLIVDGARPGDYQQALVLPGEYLLNAPASRQHRFRGEGAHGELVFKILRRDQGFELDHIDIIGFHHGSFCRIFSKQFLPFRCGI